ncbi:hypothetical protein GJAV_G00165320 [Gymnothorax javanicus]|nr:hypothetical protein GJAV_G00165320 [Gymnothorax javanicus]
MDVSVSRFGRKTKEVNYFESNEDEDESDNVSNSGSEDSDCEAPNEDSQESSLSDVDSEASETSSGSVPVTPGKRGHFAHSKAPHSRRGHLSPRKRQRRSQRVGQEASQWNLVTDPDVEPQLPCFCPTREPGVQLDSTKEYSHLELFQLFFDHEVVKTLCENTNKNADRMRTLGRQCSWEELTLKEFYRFLGLIIFMDLFKASTLKDYWSQHKVYRVMFFHKMMTQHRFSVIMRTLHFSDPAEDEENRKKRGTPDYNRLFCLRPLLDAMVLSCQAFYHPRQNLSIEERMLGARAMNMLKKRVMNNPIRKGYKLSVLVDAYNGYTCNFNIYARRRRTETGKGIRYNSVMKLINVAHLGTGYHLYVNSFYTSVPLFRDLHLRKIGACGTILKRRQGLPHTQKNALSSKSNLGEIRWIRDKELLFVMWKDIQQVCMLSTIHTVYTGDQVVRQIWTSGRKSTMLSVPMPTPVKAYNQHMGDLSDEHIKHYRVSQNTKKWYRIIFFHFVDVAVANAFLLHKDLAEKRNTSPVSQKAFREELCLQLVDAQPGDIWKRCCEPALPRSLDQSSSMVKDKPAKENEVQMPMKKLCFPVCMTEGQDVDTGSKATKGRKPCVLCVKEKNRMKTIWKCGACDVPLCLVADRNCFRDWHLLMAKEVDKDRTTDYSQQHSEEIAT